MISKLLCTDVLVIRCVNNFIFVAIGCTLHIFDADTFKLEKKLNCLYPYNIHEIVEGPNNKIAVFGANFFCSYVIYKKQGTLVIKENIGKRHFEDWIITAKWLRFCECDHLAILLAHNNVYVYDTYNDCHQGIECEERCILYAGTILLQKKNEKLIIFSGTVFQEILIWEVNYTSSCFSNASILHRLQGHNGVIFSVTYDPFTQIICSTSDDRTVRLWRVNCNKSEEKSYIDWQKAEIKLVKTMFGHTARVWRAIIKNKTLITIGEDSLMCIWSLDGKLLNKISAHHGAAIWSIDVSGDNKTIYTGGADGAVQTWAFTDNYIERTLSSVEIHKCTLPKYVCYLNSGNFLIFTEDGYLFLFNKLYDNPIESIYLETYNTYYIMKVSLCRSYVCFASRNGYVMIYKEMNMMYMTSDRKLKRILENKLMESQIYSIHWLRDNTLIACGSNGTLKIFNFAIEGSITVQSMYVLPPSRERWLTAVALYQGLLICGDRAGNMHVFEVQESTLYDQKNNTEMGSEPIQTFTKVHGNIGIQNFIDLDSKLISTGRDGVLRFYELNVYENRKLLYTLHKKKMPMDWISGSLRTFNDTLILGFKEVEFIIYSMFHQRTVTKIPCGGGHRSWDCMLMDELIAFLYIRNKKIYMFDFPLNFIKSPVLLNGFHTKEIYCFNFMSKMNRDNILISGGEDGTLRVTCVSCTVEDNVSFRTLGIFDGHISSIKSLVSLKLQPNSARSKHIVFSGGGRAQVKVWEIDIQNRENVLQDTDIFCYDITSHMLYGHDQSRKRRSPDVNQFHVVRPETRYMDIEIYHDVENLHCVLLFVACADGFVRIFSYDISRKCISLKQLAVMIIYFIFSTLKFTMKRIKKNYVCYHYQNGILLPRIMLK
ncbi:trafficking protein particle complex subunit 31 isoform X2 [Calliopsis andreniformis]|uniref:trafficking protein particle complex subunit 31 isoform X2 n=1 Tax=Calliopsis andreniformis TaxID=337506 RepID=UPI003FCE8229